MNKIIFGDNLEALKTLKDESVDLIYIDPPFNTGKPMKLDSVKTIKDDAGDRTGFGGKRYKTVKLGSVSFDDCRSDYLEFMEVRLVEGFRTKRIVFSACRL